jgi:GNAT superfamily N-acetyltransferase
MRNLIELLEEEKAVNIRNMSQDELEMVMGWAKDEGWNPGKYDYLAYYALDQNGFLILTLGDEIIGSLSILKYSQDFAFIGLFIVLPEYRNKGYGTMLWEEGLRRLSEVSMVGLYAVQQQVPRYERSEFSTHHENFRWEMEESRKESLSHLSGFFEAREHYDELVAYDQGIWGASRDSFFSSFLEKPETYIFISFNDENKVSGYGMIRPCISGYRIGPIYCDDIESAKQLTRLLQSQIPPNSNIIFDIPITNPFSEVFAEFFQLKPVESVNTMAMFKGEKEIDEEVLQTRYESCYGLASLEIG